MDNKGNNKPRMVDVENGHMVEVDGIPSYILSRNEEVMSILRDSSIPEADRQKLADWWYKRKNQLEQQYKMFTEKKQQVMASGGKLTDSDLATIFGVASSVLEDKKQDVVGSYIDGDTSDDPIKRLLSNFGFGDDGRDAAMATIEANRVDYGDLHNSKSVVDAYRNSIDNMPTERSAKGIGDRMKDNLSASAKGAAMGSAFGPWGALIGGIAGGVANLGDQLLRGDKNREIYNENIRQMKERNKQEMIDKLNRIGMAEQEKTNRLLRALGGHVDAQESFRVKGDRHTAESGGVPIGNNQIVEGGEYIHNGYVYSDRIIINEEDCENLGLPKDIAGMTFASIAEMIINEGGDDKEEVLAALADLQEFLAGRYGEQNEQTDREQSMEEEASVEENVEDLGNPDELNLTPEIFSVGGRLGTPLILRFIGDDIDLHEKVGKEIKDRYLTNHFISYPESSKFPKGYGEEKKKRGYQGKNGDKVAGRLMQNHFERKQEPNNRKEYVSFTGNGGVIGDYIEYGDDYPSLDIYGNPIERKEIVIDVRSDDTDNTEKPPVKKPSKPKLTNRDNIAFDFIRDGDKYNSEYLDFIDSIDNDSFARMKQDNQELFKNLGRDISLKDFKRLATDGKKGKVHTLASALFENNKYKAIELIPSSGV